MKSATNMLTREITTAEVVDSPTPLAPPVVVYPHEQLTCVITPQGKEQSGQSRAPRKLLNESQPIPPITHLRIQLLYSKHLGRNKGEGGGGHALC